jgi:preprotein translocase subunit YajC
MKLKLLLVTVFAAGIGASYALADDGPGKGDHKARCQEVHVSGTIAPQTLTVTLTRDARRLNLKAGSQVVVQVGTTGQTVRFNSEACSTTVGTATQLQVKQAEIRAQNPKPATTTTAPATTTGP